MNTRWKELAAKHQHIMRQMVELKKQQTVLEGAMDDAQYVTQTFHY
jgi:prefoldin subunit 5